ncbi:MAG: LacI family transcriptional regulator, partial [Cytophagaceae bacterium]
LVARALKGYPEVAESTRQRVELVAQEMGYSSGDNREARALISRRYGQRLKHGIIAVVFPPMDALSPRFMPFYETIIDGIETEARALGLDICLCPLRPNEVARLIRERNVDGVISLGYAPWHVAAIHDLELSVVCLQERCEGAHSVVHDQRDGAFQATRHLIEIGHRRIAFLGGIDSAGQISQQRLQGYKEAMHKASLSIEDEWVEISLPMPRVTPMAYCSGCGLCAACVGWQTLMAKNRNLPDSNQPNRGAGHNKSLSFTALVCHNDAIAIGAVEHARQQGFDVPHDLSVTGFDDVSRQYHFTPELTSIDFSRHVMGHHAVRLLQTVINEQDNGEVVPYQHHVLPVSLVVRESTQPLGHSRVSQERLAQL